MNNLSVMAKKCESLLGEINFVPGEQVEIYEEYISLLERLFKDTGQVIYLINIVRAEKKMYNAYTELAKKSAEAAFFKNQNEKTLYFYLESSLSNKSAASAEVMISKVFEKIKNKKLKPIEYLYKGGVANKKGHFLKSNRCFYKFKKEYMGKLYWQSEMLVVDYGLGALERDFLGNSLCELDENDVASYAISVSCESVYFEKYFKYFLESVRLICRGKVDVYLSIVNMDSNYVRKKVTDWSCDSSGVNVHIISYDVSEELKVPVSAVARLLSVSRIIESCNKPVVFCELDGLVVEDFSEIIKKGVESDSDQIVRVIGHMMPWNMFTCGFGVFYPTVSGKKAAKLVEQYSKGVFNHNSKLMWADQVVLEGAIRYSNLTDGGYKCYYAEAGEIKRYMFTPTGSGDKKYNSILRNLYFISNPIQVVGLQRSGTNFLTEILRNGQKKRRVLETGNNIYAWKHALPHESKLTSVRCATVQEAVSKERGLNIALLSKHPLWWLSSIMNRNPADLRKHRPYIYNENGDIDAVKAISFYIDFYRAWLTSFPAEKVFHFRYEDLLKDLKAEFLNLNDFFEIDLDFDLNADDINVKYSKGSFSDKKDLYLNSELDIDVSVLDGLIKNMRKEDVEFIKSMGYEMER